MKRDLLLCAEIIKAIAEHGDFPITTLDAESTKRRAYHYGLLLQAGLITQKHELSMTGWDFYAYANSPFFKDAHDAIMTVLGGTSYSLLVDMIDAIASNKVIASPLPMYEP